MRLIIENAILNKEIPGMNYAVIEKDKVVKETLGTNGLSEQSLNQNALYDIASLTKLFTTTRILQLIEEERLNLTDPVSKHLENFINKEITIESCLNHSSGLAPSVSIRHTHDKEDIIQSIYDCIDFINPVNQVTQYSCINFIVLGFVIEAVDGIVLEESFTRNIFTPLGMKATSYNPVFNENIVATEISKDRGLIQGTVHDETVFKLDGMSGSAGLFSTMDDLILFTQGIMNNTLYSKATQERVNEYDKNSRSLGWNRYTKDMIYHTGFTGPSIAIDTKNKRALILLTNRTYPSRDNQDYLKSRLEIFDAFLEKKTSL